LWVLSPFLWYDSSTGRPHLGESMIAVLR